jgi:hypothetical protein
VPLRCPSVCRLGRNRDCWQAGPLLFAGGMRGMKTSMHRIPSLVVLSCCLALAACTFAPAPTVMSPAPAPTGAAELQEDLRATLAVVNGTLIDGTGAAPIANAVVLVRDGRVVAAGTHSVVGIPDNARVISAEGGTILPGFINAHVHAAYDLETLAARAQGGVTTVRDLGSRTVPAPFHIRDEAADDQVRASGCCRSDGHGAWRLSHCDLGWPRVDGFHDRGGTPRRQ